MCFTTPSALSLWSALHKLKADGVVKHIGTSIHDRPRAGQLAKDKVYDMLMVRYNAAHPGAEQDIFPHVDAQSTAVLWASTWGKMSCSAPG